LYKIGKKKKEKKKKKKKKKDIKKEKKKGEGPCDSRVDCVGGKVQKLLIDAPCATNIKAQDDKSTKVSYGRACAN
jgi:hypothetical protein